MAVLKNQIPILEFDTEQSTVIMPGHHSDYHFSQKGVMLFMEPEIDDFVAHNECEVIGKFVSVTKDFYVYKTKIDNIDIAFTKQQNYDIYDDLSLHKLPTAYAGRSVIKPALYKNGDI